MSFVLLTFGSSKNVVPGRREAALVFPRVVMACEGKGESLSHFLIYPEYETPSKLDENGPILPILLEQGVYASFVSSCVTDRALIILCP